MEKVIKRIKKRPEFLKIAKKGEKWVTQGLVLQVLADDSDKNTNHIGFTVSKKVGNAIVRNKVKRRLRSLVSEIIPEHASFGYKMVFIGRHKAFKMDYKDLYKNMYKALLKTGVIVK